MLKVCTLSLDTYYVLNPVKLLAITCHKDLNKHIFSVFTPDNTSSKERDVRDIVSLIPKYNIFLFMTDVTVSCVFLRVSSQCQS